MLFPDGRKRQNAFTLIELLVVISIISLLASIILAATAAARIRAQNSAVDSEIGQYEKALQAYAAEFGVFPNPGTPQNPITSGSYCLGRYTNSTCYFGSAPYTENAAIESEIINYMPNLPAIPPINPVLIGGLQYDGAIYNCNSSQYSCQTSFVYWLEQSNGTCNRGKVYTNDGLPVTGNGYTVCYDTVTI